MTCDDGIDDWTFSQIKTMAHLPTSINSKFASLLAHQWNVPAARERLLAGARKEAEREPTRGHKRQEPRWNSRGWIIRFVDAGPKKDAVIKEVVGSSFFYGSIPRSPYSLDADKKRKAGVEELVNSKRWHASREGFSEGEAYDLVERFAKLGAKIETLGFDSAFEAAVFTALDQIILSPETQDQLQDQQPTYIDTIADLFSRDILNEGPYTDEEVERVIAYMQCRELPPGKPVPKSQSTRSIPSIEAGERWDDQWA